VSWAIACISFAGIIESSRLLSPFSYLGLKQPYLTTIGDHTLGGAIAGAVFRGMQIQSGKSKSPILAPRIMAGLIPGVTLGLLAGCLQATVDTLETILNDEQANAAAQLEIERIKASLTGSKQQKDEENEPHQK